MSNSLTRRLGLSERDVVKVQKTVGSIKSVTDFLTDAAKALDKLKLPEAIARAVPWIAYAGSVAPAVPVVAFLLKLFSRLAAETDPDALAYLASTFAYERSVEQAILAVGEPKKPKELTADMKRAFEALRPAEDMNFATLSFADALQHPFVREADGFLEIFAGAVGYDKIERRRLVSEVHSRFVVNLKTMLSQASLRDRFGPLVERLRFGVGEVVAYEALFEHADLQRRLFEEAPVLGTEPFTLTQVYVDLDCGRLTWGQIRDGGKDTAPRGTGREKKPIDPFSELWGGREALLGTVMDLIGDPEFRDAIVIQGVAGAGKSAFTLRLAAELIHEGLRPIRVRMRDLAFDRHAGEAIRQAVKLSDEAHPSAVKRGTPDDLFMRGSIWNEEVTFGRARVCPYVIILDGWDEISVSVTEGFRVRLDRMLEQVRSEYLSNREVPIRVIVTGRPSRALTEGSFLRDRTAVLTMRPFRPDQLETFLKKLADALKKPPAEVAAPSWSIDLKRYRPVMTQYKRDFSSRSGEKSELDADAGRGSMDVLGLPLLSHIAVRLMATWQGEIADLVRSPTTLYRSLVDLTCERAGQVGALALDPAARPRLTGAHLRSLLRRTAAAISVHGEESISYSELQRRLRLDAQDLAAKAEQATSDFVLTALMVSFYFKSGQRELGCEFVHKSFREYLFAEAIVEQLKEYGRRKQRELPVRSPAWQEFPDDDRLALSRGLAELLAPQWLSVEVTGHVERLVEWEILRAGASDLDGGPGRATEPLELRRWEAVRDGLADLWEWWGDGVHLRPQPVQQERGGVALGPAYADKLVDWAAPQAVEWGDTKLVPARTLTMDAHLGDALFRLAASTHFHLAAQTGWLERGRSPEGLWAGVAEAGAGTRPCQSEIRSGNQRWVFFAPSRDNPELFANYVQRVNAEGFRPGGPFPLGVDARGIDLRSASFQVPNPQTPPRRSVFRYANMRGITASGSCFYSASMDDVLLREAILDRAELVNVWLEGSDLRDASLVRADLTQAFLHDADLRGADLEGANLRQAMLAHADLRGAELRHANLTGADLENAKVDGPKEK